MLWSEAVLCEEKVSGNTMSVSAMNSCRYTAKTKSSHSLSDFTRFTLTAHNGKNF